MLTGSGETKGRAPALGLVITAFTVAVMLLTVRPAHADTSNARGDTSEFSEARVVEGSVIGG